MSKTLIIMKKLEGKIAKQQIADTTNEELNYAG
jgi:hypothetical protein